MVEEVVVVELLLLVLTKTMSVLILRLFVPLKGLLLALLVLL